MKTKLLILIVLLLSFTFTNSQSYFDKLEKQERKEHEIVYWEYGLPAFEITFAREKVAKHYGFYFNHVAGCVVSDKTVARIDKHNKKVNNLLSKKIGADWKKIVYHAVDSVYKIDTTLLNNFHVDWVFLDTLVKLLDEIKDPYELRVNPTADPTIFNIDAFFIDKEWNVTNKSFLKIEATYPKISYRIIRQQHDNSITSGKKFSH